MTKHEIFKRLELAYRANKKKGGSWPDHVVAQAAMVTNQAAKIQRVALQQKYCQPKANVKSIERARIAAMEQSAFDTIVEAIKFLEHLNSKK